MSSGVQKLMSWDFTRRHNMPLLAEFAAILEKTSDEIGFRISTRGWCYQLEQMRLINKNQFNKVEDVINKCRKNGLLPIDFVAEEEGRRFSCVHEPDSQSPVKYMRGMLKYPLNAEHYYTPDWWDGEEYYIQMIVEKIDLKTLFEPVCNDYHIPVATSKGWSSMLQRGEYAKRFQEAEDKGLQCVLLYCGDHDPDGLRISDFLRSNLEDIKDIHWEDGTRGFDPSGLVIQRFGLDYKFIKDNNLTWIDNLITGSGKDLADKNHKNNKLPYLQNYIHTYGVRKCEANAIVPLPKKAKALVTEAIEEYLGKDALKRFQAKRDKVAQELEKFREDSGLTVAINNAIKLIDDWNG